MSMGATLAVGLVLLLLGRGASDEFYRREALAIVGFGWTLSAVMGSLPFILSGMLMPIDALFEATSGLTCTGSTVVTDIGAAIGGATPRHGVMFWRSFTHWLGGMGIVVLLLALLPAVGAGSRFLFQSEMSGLTAEGLRPRIRQTALRLWFLYMALSAVFFGTFWLCGMSIYDSMCHTFGTIATAGFSTKNASIAAFDSVKIECVLLLFMFLAGTSFTLHCRVARGEWTAWLRSPEWRIFLGVVLVCTGLVTLALWVRGPYDDGLGAILRRSSFTVMSIATTTGFATADFDLWPASSKMLLLVLMFMGGCAGSTSGGLKVIRVLVLIKIARRQMQRIFNPRRIQSLRIGGQTLDDDLEHTALAYFLIMIGIYIGATLIMALVIGRTDDNTHLVTATTSVFATLNNIGPGLAAVGPTETFAHIPAAGKLVLALCMIAGRLELWAILCLFAPSFWRSR